MKAPNLKDLSRIKKQDSFSKMVEAVQIQQALMEKKTYTLDQNSIDIINSVALKLGQEKGAVVTASEAVRYICSQYKES